jgi:hypothetical protein
LDPHAISPNSLFRKVGSYLGYTISPAEVEASERKMRANLIYEVDEAPPVLPSLMHSMQHVFVLWQGWIFVVVLVTSVAGPPTRRPIEEFEELGNLSVPLVALPSATAIELPERARRQRENLA